MSTSVVKRFAQFSLDLENTKTALGGGFQGLGT